MTPRPTQVLDFDSEMNEKPNEGKTESKRERRRKLAAITNPYSASGSKRTPTVTPQKATPHTKPKRMEQTPRTNLNSPPPYSLSHTTQIIEDEHRPMQELVDFVQNTEQTLDQAMAKFHQDHQDNQVS
jgi:hypothetical protein